MAEYNTQSQRRGSRPPLGKPPGTGNPKATVAAGGERVSSEPREVMIREAAYLRAEQRAFAPGNELGDWLDAEREIDAALARRKTQSVRGG